QRAVTQCGNAESLDQPVAKRVVAIILRSRHLRQVVKVAHTVVTGYPVTRAKFERADRRFQGAEKRLVTQPPGKSRRREVTPPVTRRKFRRSIRTERRG